MKQKISVASRRSTPKDLSRNHYTTLGFGHIYPVLSEEVPNGSKLTFSVSNFSRLSAQFLPNLGTIKMKIHAFYVPFNLVWNHFEHFHTGLPSWNSNGSQVFKYVPTLSSCDFSFMFYGHVEMAEEVEINEDWDFNITRQYSDPTQEPSDHYYKFTSKGKYVYHVLNALGINFNFLDMSYYNDERNDAFSILPLMCFFKLYLDYFIPSQFQPSSYLHSLTNFLHELTASQCTSLYNRTNDVLAQDLQGRIYDYFDEMYYYYQNNYFTSAWMSPNAPAPNLQNIGSTTVDYPVINSINSQSPAPGDGLAYFKSQPLTNTTDGVSRTNVPINNNTTSTLVQNNASARLSADGITFLQKFARFVKRSNFVGSRPLERILSMFGVRVTEFQSGLSTYLGSDEIVLQQTDVTVTGNTAESGEMSGKAWFAGNGNRKFKADCDLYGYVFITASLDVPSTPLDGVRRRNHHIQPLDFYNPDMDGSTMQAISGSELFGRLNVQAGQSTQLVSMNLLPNQVYGYQMRYQEFKQSIDDISGDFCVPTLRANIDAFILPRRLFDLQKLRDDIIDDASYDGFKLRDYAYSPTISDVSNSSFTPPVLIKGDDMWQFNRIFKDTDGYADPTFSVFRIDLIVNNGVLPLSTSAELDGRGKEIDFEMNGVHV